MSRPTKPTLPRGSTTEPGAVIHNAASISGNHPITLGANSVIQARARLTSAYGPVVLWEGCLVAEKAVVGFQSRPAEDGKGVVLGKGVVVESGARIEGEVGEGGMVEAGAGVGVGSVLGKYCKVSPLCSVAANEALPDYTIVYGNSPTERRIEKKGLEALRAKAVEKHGELLKEL